MFIDVIQPLTQQSVSSSVSTLHNIFEKLTNYAVELAGKILVALIIFFVGRFLINRIRIILSKIMARKNMDETVRSFLDSLINISLQSPLSCYYRW